MKDLLRSIFRSLPFKHSVLLGLRNLGLGKIIPARIKPYLVFDEAFEVHLRHENVRFAINNGYGREIEAMMFWDGLESFEAETMFLWRRLASEAKVIIDVGANTGVFSLVAKAINPKARVIAFEPVLRVHRALQENLELNRESIGQVSLVEAFQVALSDYNGSGVIYDLPVEHMYTASLNKDIHLERSQPIKSIESTVSVQRLDHFCLAHNIVPDLIKIDVESHEPYVLRGMGDLLKAHQPSLICEVWDNTVGSAIEAVLENCGYRFFAIGNVILETTHVRNDAPENGYINYLFISEKVANTLSLNIPRKHE